MLVQVHWKNDHYDYVEDYLLDSLIEAGAVIRFLRLSGWVTIGRDQIRSMNHASEYRGVERRSDGASLQESEFTEVMEMQHGKDSVHQRRAENRRV